MPNGNYSQYNTNAIAVLNAHSAAYFAWYEAAVVIYVVGAIAFVAWLFFRARALLAGAIALAAAGAACQAASLGLRWFYSGHVPWNDLYGSLSVVTFFTVVLFMVFGARYKIWFAGPFVLGFTDALLGYARYWNKGLEPLVPSLQSYWIYIHVPVVLSAYAAFLIGFCTSILYLLKRRDEGRLTAVAGKSVGAAVAESPAAAALPRAAYLAWLDLVPASVKLDIVTYRVNAIGEILLTFGIILGALWAHDVWGSYWQWDPKETAILVSWIIYAAYLHLHTRPSMRGEASAWVSIVAFLSIMFCYFGINIWISGLNSLHTYR